MNYQRLLIHTFLLAAVCFVADFWRFMDIGLFTDDWIIAREFLFNIPTTPSWASLSFSLSENRPLIFVPLNMLKAGFSIGGIAGARMLVWIILVVNAALVGVLVRRRLGVVGGEIASFIFLLYPADTTHLWIISFNIRFAVLLALLAIASYAVGRRSVALLLLVACACIYEIAPVIFVLAPWVATGGRTDDIQRAVILTIKAVLIYLCIRGSLGFFGYSDSRMDSSLSFVGGWGTVDSWIADLVGIPYVVVVRWIARSLKRALSVEGLPSFAAGLIGFTVLCAIRAKEMTDKRPILVRFRPESSHGEHRYSVVVSTDNEGVALFEGLVWAVAAIVTLSVFSVFQHPNFGWSTVTRANYVISIPVSILLAVVAFLTCRVLSSRLARIGVILALVVILSSFVSFRWRVQNQYVGATQLQRLSLQNLVEDLNGIPQGSHVLVRTILKGDPTKAIFPFAPKPAYLQDVMMAEMDNILKALFGLGVGADPVWDREIDLGILSQAAKKVGPGGVLMEYDMEQRKLTLLSDKGVGDVRLQARGLALEYTRSDLGFRSK